jgi:hypothetical protein
MVQSKFKNGSQANGLMSQFQDDTEWLESEDEDCVGDEFDARPS